MTSMRQALREAALPGLGAGVLVGVLTVALQWGVLGVYVAAAIMIPLAALWAERRSGLGR